MRVAQVRVFDKLYTRDKHQAQLRAAVARDCRRAVSSVLSFYPQQVATMSLTSAAEAIAAIRESFKPLSRWLLNV